MRIYNFTIKTFQRNLLIAFLLIIAISYSFSAIFFGLDFTDSFYHINQALNPANGIYLYPFILSSIIIKHIVEVAGPEVINFRVINWFLLSLSLFLPFLLLKVRKARETILFYIAITFILYTPFNANILGYDTLSIFFLSIIFSVTALYIKTRKIYLVFFLSLFCAAAILIRLPNVLIIPMIFLFLLVTESVGLKKLYFRKILIPVIYLLLTSLFTFACYSFYYDTWNHFILATSNSESHNLLLLFSNYLKDGFKIVGFIFLILFGLFGYKKINLNRQLLVKDGVLIIFFIVSLYFFVGYTKFSINYALFLVALAISILIIEIYNGFKEKFSESRLVIFLFITFLFVNPLGSSTGLLKAYSLLLLFPFILSISKLKDKKYWLILVAVLIPFSILTKVFGIYEDKNLMALSEELKLQKLSPIRTNRERAFYLEETDNLVQNLFSRGVEVYFYGDKSHIFHYLYPETFLHNKSFFQPVDDFSYVQDILDMVRDKDQVAVFIVETYPVLEPSPLPSLMEKELLKRNFEKLYNGNIIYYLKSED